MILMNIVLPVACMSMYERISMIKRRTIGDEIIQGMKAAIGFMQGKKTQVAVHLVKITKGNNTVIPGKRIKLIKNRCRKNTG